MLFLVKKGTNVIVAKDISDKSFQQDSLKKTKAKSDMAFSRDLIVLDPFGLKEGAINQLTSSNDDINELLAKGYYGFKNKNTDHIFLIRSENLKLF